VRHLPNNSGVLPTLNAKNDITTLLVFVIRICFSHFLCHYKNINKNLKIAKARSLARFALKVYVRFPIAE